MNSKDKTNLIKKCKKILPRNSEILFLGVDTNIDDLNDTSNYFCVYLPPASEMLLANKLPKGCPDNSDIFYYPIQNFLDNNLHLDTDKLINIFLDIDRDDSIINTTSMENISKNRNMLLDTKKKVFDTQFYKCLTPQFLEIRKSISASYQNCQLTPEQLQNIEKQNAEDNPAYMKDLLECADRGFQWDGIYHQGFVDSFILSLYAGIDMDDSEVTEEEMNFCEMYL